MSQRSIVLDLLVLSSCGHPSESRLEKSVEIVGKLEEGSSCWRELEEALKELGSREPVRCGSRGVRKIYVSDRSLRNLRKFMRALAESGRKLDVVIKLRYIAVAASLYGPRLRALEAVKVKEEGCDLRGHHAEEYCELRKALKATLEGCELLCGILCSGETFGEGHVLRLGKCLGVEVAVRDAVRSEDLGVRIVEVVKGGGESL